MTPDFRMTLPKASLTPFLMHCIFSLLHLNQNSVSLTNVMVVLIMNNRIDQSNQVLLRVLVYPEVHYFLNFCCNDWTVWLQFFEMSSPKQPLPRTLEGTSNRPPNESYQGCIKVISQNSPQGHWTGQYSYWATASELKNEVFQAVKIILLHEFIGPFLYLKSGVTLKFIIELTIKQEWNMTTCYPHHKTSDRHLRSMPILISGISHYPTERSLKKKLKSMTKEFSKSLWKEEPSEKR